MLLWAFEGLQISSRYLTLSLNLFNHLNNLYSTLFLYLFNHLLHVESVRYYYDISYNYHYIVNGNEISRDTDYNPYSLLTIQKTNPFYYYRNNVSDDSLEGVIALSNRVTDALVEQLLMTDEELERELCNKWVVQYRTHLMYTLSTFWD